MNRPPSGSPVAPAEDPPRIVDLIFAGEEVGGWRRLALCLAAAMVLETGVLSLLRGHGPSLASLGAQRASPVDPVIAPSWVIDVDPFPAPAAAAPAAAGQRVATTRVARPAHTVRRGQSAAPAQAGQLAAAAAPAASNAAETTLAAGADPSDTVGATTTTAGTARPQPAPGAAAGRAGVGATPPSGGARRTRAVALDQAAWNCAWPAEADAQQIDEETVVLRASVGSDGEATRVDILADPGFGFGEAARRCALATRFEPARDAAGRPIAAPSPPIRVHFYR